VAQIMNGLIVSSEDEIRLRLAEMLDDNGLASIFASSVNESGMRLSGCKVQIVVCQDRLVDGEYDAILRIMKQINVGAPVIVFSRTGDWPEYLTALRTGVFDYLAYPLLRGEFERILRNALREYETLYPFRRNRIGRQPCSKAE
jgi:DNA-binding NtrC family response regulator